MHHVLVCQSGESEPLKFKCSEIVAKSILEYITDNVYYDNPLTTLQIRTKSLNRAVDSCLLLIHIWMGPGLILGKLIDVLEAIW